MATRITHKELELLVKRLNVVAMPEKGREFILTLTRANGGYALHKLTSDQGSVRDVSGMGYTTPAALYGFLRGMLAGHFLAVTDAQTRALEALV